MDLTKLVQHLEEQQGTLKKDIAESSGQLEQLEIALSALKGLRVHKKEKSVLSGTKRSYIRRQPIKSKAADEAPVKKARYGKHNPHWTQLPKNKKRVARHLKKIRMEALRAEKAKK